MNADLEQMIGELGPDYRAVVTRLKNAAMADDISACVVRHGPEIRPTTFARRHAACLIAASLAILAGIGVLFRSMQHSHGSATAHFGAHEYRTSVAEMIAAQNPDGSWQNDFLTRRNAEALKGRQDFASRVAYKKAVRNLRLRGVL